MFYLGMVLEHATVFLLPSKTYEIDVRNESFLVCECAASCLPSRSCLNLACSNNVHKTKRTVLHETEAMVFSSRPVTRFGRHSFFLTRNMGWTYLGSLVPVGSTSLGLESQIPYCKCDSGKYKKGLATGPVPFFPRPPFHSVGILVGGIEIFPDRVWGIGNKQLRSHLHAYQWLKSLNAML